jgi:carbamoyl-phosphate synthase small subunit
VKLSRPALLALEDGSLLEGLAFGHSSHSAVFTVGEVVFNTSMTGYEEILTDPSYAGQLIALTYPHIGNVGINLDDRESNAIFARGLIIRQLPLRVSNWRQQTTLEQFLVQHRILGISDIDTRHLTHLLREKGALRGCIFSAPTIGEQEIEKALAIARGFSGLQGLDLAQEVSTSTSYLWQEGGMWSRDKRTCNAKGGFHVVAYDFGIKKTILRRLQEANCVITVVNAKTTAQEVMELDPDGIFLSNGPGDPEPCDYAIAAIQSFLQAKIPLFGICLGHQLLALACNAKTVKMKVGHHGANHPVRSLKNQRVLITSQNHGFTVDDNNLPDCLEVTHRSLFDNTIQGLQHKTAPAFSFQGHPEAGPGPNDATGLFDAFVQSMINYQAKREKTLLTAME